jgi:uncharacterized membrane protein
MAQGNLCNPVLPSTLGGCDGGGQTGGTIIGKLIGNIVSVVFILGFCLAFAYLLTGAVSWITSNGEKGQLEAARNKITHAIIGLIILASVYAIMTLVTNFLGLSTGDGLTLPIPSIQP